MEEDNIIAEPKIETDDETHRALNNLRIAFQTPSILNYSEFLDQDAGKEGIKIAAVDPSELEEEEGILEKERILGITSLAKAHHEHQLQLLSKEQKARKKLQSQYSKQLKNYQHLKDNSAHTHQLQQVQVSKAFRKNELAIKTAMKKTNADLKVTLESNSNDQLLYGGINRVYKITWRGRPQVVEVRIEECRDIKDKLEKGKYWIRIHTKDKIGGKILEFQKQTEEWNNLSDPYPHDGKYSSKAIKFRTTLKVLVPSQIEITPTMVYCFQILDNNAVIVGEGYFPIINNLFEVSQGKYKVPIVRSSLKNAIDKFSGIEELYRENIDEWLCNLYFEVTLLPQVIEGESDYMIQIHGSKVLKEEVTTEPDQKDYEELITPDQYSEYKHSVAITGILTSPKNKLQYIMAELTIEFGFKIWRHWYIYQNFIFLILLIWVCRYIHYAGQWIYLKADSFPITTFQALIFTIEIRFPNQTNLTQEILLLIIGTLFICFWFLLFCLWIWVSLKWIGRFPEVLFRIIQCWGLVMIFDPLITLVEAGIWAAAYNYWEIDPFRLYNYFETAEGNGVIGILLTVFLYAGLIGFCSFVFYNYFLFFHMNGRLLDIYMRLNAQDNRFFIPHDGEISKRYLEWVCYKARNYRSMNGESRKVTVMNYKMFEGFNAEVTKTAMHVIVYTVGNDRSRAVYRQFLRLPDGAITELSLTESSRRTTYSNR